MVVVFVRVLNVFVIVLFCLLGFVLAYTVFIRFVRFSPISGRAPCLFCCVVVVCLCWLVSDCRFVIWLCVVVVVCFLLLLVYLMLALLLYCFCIVCVLNLFVLYVLDVVVFGRLLTVFD